MSRLEQIVEPLLAWYEKNARDLPWRHGVTPYRVWISEIMLQQTRVEAVKGYFERFMQALPDVESLSSVEEETSSEAPQEGLGYYSRARNLKRAAALIMERYGGTARSTATNCSSCLALVHIRPARVRRSHMGWQNRRSWRMLRVLTRSGG